MILIFVWNQFLGGSLLRDVTCTEFEVDISIASNIWISLVSQLPKSNLEITKQKQFQIRTSLIKNWIWSKKLTFTSVSMNKLHSNFLLKSIWIAHQRLCVTKKWFDHQSCLSSCLVVRQKCLRDIFRFPIKLPRHSSVVDVFIHMERTKAAQLMKNPRVDKQVAAHSTWRAARGGREKIVIIICCMVTTLPVALTPLSLTHKVKSIANYNNARDGGQAGKFN